MKISHTIRIQLVLVNRFEYETTSDSSRSGRTKIACSEKKTSPVLEEVLRSLQKHEQKHLVNNYKIINKCFKTF